MSTPAPRFRFAYEDTVPAVVPNPSRILVVTDAPSRSTMVKAVRSQLRWEVLAASEPARALDLVTTRAISLAVVDLAFGGGAGMHLLRELRESPRTAHLPVLAVGGAGISAEQECLELGAEHYFAGVPAPELLRRLISVKLQRVAEIAAALERSRSAVPRSRRA